MAVNDTNKSIQNLSPPIKTNPIAKTIFLQKHLNLQINQTHFSLKSKPFLLFN